MDRFLPNLVILFLLVGLSDQTEAAAELSLICLCKAERVGQTAVRITAGVCDEQGDLQGKFNAFEITAFAPAG